MKNWTPISFKTYGPYGIIIEWEETIHQGLNQTILNLHHQLTEWSETEESIPTYHSLLWINRKRWVPINDFKQKVKNLLNVDDAEVPASKPYKKVFLPVCYDGQTGADLEALAMKLNLSVKQLIQEHTRPDYHVYFLGFLPGFPYLGGLSAKLHYPRKKIPRPKIPAGSVGIGGAQTGIYPVESPGGWQIIGRCPLPLFFPGYDDLALIQPGEKIKFIPISYSSYLEWSAQYTLLQTDIRRLKQIIKDETHF